MAANAFDAGSQRAEEVQEVLLLLNRERLKVADHAIGLGSIALMRKDRRLDVRGAAIVKEEQPLAGAPPVANT
jgi:hypothetical protein